MHGYVGVTTGANNANIQTDTYDTPYRVGPNLIVISRFPAANSAVNLYCILMRKKEGPPLC